MPEPVADGAADLELLTVADVCALFQVTKDWIYDEVEAGRLPYVRLGRKHLRFRRQDLVGYLEQAQIADVLRCSERFESVLLQATPCPDDGRITKQEES